MINITTNITEVFSQALDRFKNVDTNKMCREQATTLMAVVKQRVHTQGLDSNGARIGTYSEPYMKVRSGAYENADTYKKGAKAGTNKNSGTFTKGSKAGGSRPKYNRGSDTKVILSLTRQMENDLVIKKIENGWGIGYANLVNFKKSMWSELKYHKKIFNLTSKEREMANDIAEKYIQNATK
jgi:hypothetical protein